MLWTHVNVRVKRDSTRSNARSVSSFPSSRPLTVITCHKMTDAIDKKKTTTTQDRRDNVRTLICSPPTCLGSSARFMSLIKHFQHRHHHPATQI